MPKMTLLSMTQKVLNDLSGDVVNSIGDTPDATQVANIIEDVYWAMMDSRHWPHLTRTFVLENSLDVARPNYLILPENVNKLNYLYYNVRKLEDTSDSYREIIYLEPEEFLKHSHNLNSSNSNVVLVTDYGGVSYYIMNDQPPTYWTSFDDEHLAFDAYDSAVDTTLVASKTQVHGEVHPTWTMSDDFIPDLPAEAFQELLNEAKSLAFIIIKQVENAKAEQYAKRLKHYQTRNSWKAKGGISYPDYGRKGLGTGIGASKRF